MSSYLMSLMNFDKGPYNEKVKNALEAFLLSRDRYDQSTNQKKSRIGENSISSRSSSGISCGRFSDTSSTGSDESADHQEFTDDYFKNKFAFIKIGDILCSRFFILRKLGYGVSSTIWLSWDLVKKDVFALKIMRADGECEDSQKIEMNMLRKIRNKNPAHIGYNNICHIIETFHHSDFNGDHYLFVFEVLGRNLLRHFQKSPNVRLDHSEVKSITKDIMLGLHYLHDECKVVHTDIKPENIMLKLSEAEILDLAASTLEIISEPKTIPNSFKITPIGDDLKELQAMQDKYLAKKNNNRKNKNKIKEPQNFGSFEEIVADIKIEVQKRISLLKDNSNKDDEVHVCIGDFGLACEQSKHYSEAIGTTEYRSPETLLLNKNWDYGVDVWGAGCVIFEIATGALLFDPERTNNEFKKDLSHLEQIVSILKNFSPQYLKKCDDAKLFFKKGNTLIHQKPRKKTSLRKLLSNENLHPPNIEELVPFLEKLLEIEPELRATASQALKLPFCL